VACNFNSSIETEGLYKVTGSHVHCKSGDVSDTVQDIYTVSQKGCHSNHGYNFVNSWSTCKILSLLKEH